MRYPGRRSNCLGTVQFPDRVANIVAGSVSRGKVRLGGLPPRRLFGLLCSPGCCSRERATRKVLFSATKRWNSSLVR